MSDPVPEIVLYGPENQGVHQILLRRQDDESIVQLFAVADDYPYHEAHFMCENGEVAPYLEVYDAGADVVDAEERVYDIGVWTPGNIALLGKISDSDLAGRLGLNKSSVREKRLRLGIAPHAPIGVWTPESIALLGTMTDVELANKLGISKPTVCEKRRRFGIAPYRVARFWTPEEIALIGTMSDGEVGKIIGVLKPTVETKRKKLGIASFSRNKHSKTDYLELLGKMSDCEIARKFGYSRESVRCERVRLRIPPYKPLTGPASDEP